jgi:GT2 family glycosyltransferase
VSERLRFAIIPTRDRPEEYAACLAAIAPQVDDIVTVCHGGSSASYATGALISYAHESPNISAMWNLGLDAIADRLALLADGLTVPPYDVAILNDDAVVPPHWFDHLGHMHLLDAAAACVDQHGRLDAPLVHRAPGRVDLRERLTGYAFVLDGTRGIRQRGDAMVAL